MIVHFAPFHADLTDERLWRGSQPVSLTPKAWGVLRALLEAGGRLVTKADLHAAVWPDTHVGDDSLTKAIRELRRALGDQTSAPRFIATVHGRGFRFVAPLWDRIGESAAGKPAEAEGPIVIGREAEQAALAAWLRDALDGHRQVGFVSGEPGIGKTSLIEAFLARMEAQARASLWVASGTCFRQYGEAEAFLPVISALRHLCCTTGGAAAAAIIRRTAPAWLVRACGVAESTAASKDAPASHGGVLRALAELIEAIAVEAPLLLVLEDLHWSDASTLDLISLLARRTDSARLLVLGTLQPATALAAGHPSIAIKRELRRMQRCRVIAMEGLTLPGVGSYLAARLPGGAVSPGVSEHLWTRSGGNPLFLGALTDDLRARDVLVDDGGRWVLRGGDARVPTRLMGAIALRLERLLAPERALLEAACVVGDSFSSDAVAAALGGQGDDSETSLERAEALCERLVRHQDILCRSSDGTGRYAFRHTLFRQAIYDGVAPARRRRLHRRTGEWLARVRAGCLEGAGELAEHFASAGDDAQAAAYHAEAADLARLRSADSEAALHLRAALTHLRRCPPGAERDRRELALLLQLAPLALAVSGRADGAVAGAYRRAQLLARRLTMPVAHFVATAGLFLFRFMRAELDAAESLAGELERTAYGLALTQCTTGARMARAAVLLSRGDFAGTGRCLEGLSIAAGPRDPNDPVDAGVFLLALRASALAMLADRQAARAAGAELLARATTFGTPFDIACAHLLLALTEALLHAARASRAHAEVACHLADRHGFPIVMLIAAQLRGWAMALLGEPDAGIAALRTADAQYRAAGYRLALPLFAALHADACLAAGDLAGAESALGAGIQQAEESGEHSLDRELHRLRDEWEQRAARVSSAADRAVSRARASAADG